MIEFWQSTTMYIKRLAVLLIIATIALAQPEAQAQDWFHQHTISGQSTPVSRLSIKAADVIAPDVLAVSIDQPSRANSNHNQAFIDLTISLVSDPEGDDNGNKQGILFRSEQDKWERIIQHFADAVFEMTNGAHLIREVRVFRDSTNFGSAQIRWDKLGHPHVPAKGGVELGGHINMYETFEDGICDADGNCRNKDMLADEELSGYVMAHEWGHYYLGIYDEYVIRTDTDVRVEPSIMSSTWKARGGDYDWLNFSIANDGGGPFQNTKLTWQHDAYGDGGWPVLSRHPDNDPTDEDSVRDRGLGPRRYYPELASHAPAVGETPRIDLPSATARSVLDIIWATDTQNIEIVIDRSGSMAGTPLSQALTAAKLLVDRAVLGQTRIGVTAFDGGVSNIVDMTLIDVEATRTAIKSAIDSIGAGGSTAIGDAAAEALDKVQATRTSGENAVVFLLSDGASNSGRAPFSVIPDYVAAKVPLFTFGFGDGADVATLRTMAEKTAGEFFRSPTTLKEIVAAFQAAIRTALSIPGLGQGTIVAAEGTGRNTLLPVDSSLERLQLSITYTGSAPASSFVLLDPSGQAVSPNSVSSAGDETLLFFDIEQPAAGNWSFGSTGVDAVDFDYVVTGVEEGVGISVDSDVRGNERRISSPGPVIIESRLSGRRPIAGAQVVARVVDASGRISRFAMRDDGNAPDTTADDGFYAGYVSPTAGGSHTVTIEFSNPELTARETYVGSTRTPNSAGKAGPAPPDEVLAENFVRSETFQFSVEFDNGWEFDIPDLGAAAALTQGALQSWTAGYGRISPGSRMTSPSGFAIFSQTRKGVTISEASVEAVTLIHEGRIFAEVGNFVNTAIAIANPNNRPADISFFFTDLAGNNFGHDSFTLGANKQTVSLLNQTPFNVADSVLGTLTFTSSLPVAAVALRTFMNERSDSLITTLPVVPLSGGFVNALSFAHFASGGGWKTEVVLVNPTVATITGTMEFREPGRGFASAPLAAVTLDDGSSGSSFAYSIPPGSATRWTTTDQGALTTGSIRVTPDGTSALPGGLTVFSFRNREGVTVTSAGVQAAPSATAFRVYVEASGTPGEQGSIRSGFAVANDSGTVNTVTLELLGVDGAAVSAPQTVSLAPFGQMSGLLDEVFSPLPNFSGVLRITATSNVSVVGLRARTNQRGDFLISTTPPSNEADAPPNTETYFPHFAVSGGWTTQFVLFSGTTDQTSSGTVRFFDQSGEPLALALSPTEDPKAGALRVFDGMEFVWVPAGEFQMGSTSRHAESDEQPVTRVSFTKGFYLGKYEVTQAQWRALMGNNPSKFNNCGGDCPVEQVTWEETQEFIRRLNARSGGEKYRLPTEAEWEYAARAGTTTDTYAGDITRSRGNDPVLNGIAWYAENSGSTPHPVGRKAPNGWGLYDMLGNVWEWVGDWHGDYPGGRRTGPSGPSSGSGRVFRGGGWYFHAWVCRSANRDRASPGSRDGSLGFRLLRTE